MADSGEDTSTATKHVFPFFKLSRELRNLVYKELSLQSSITTTLQTIFGDSSVADLGTVVWTGHAEVKHQLVSRQFRTEYIEESRRHLAMTIAYRPCCEWKSPHDAMLQAFERSNKSSESVLHYVRECTINLNDSETEYRAEYHVDRFVDDLAFAMQLLPNLRSLRLEIILVSGSDDFDFELQPVRWDLTGKSWHPLNVFDLTGPTLGFNGDVQVCLFIGRYIYKETGADQHYMDPTRQCRLGAGTIEVELPVVHYRATRSADPNAYLGLDFEPVWRAGDDAVFLAERLADESRTDDEKVLVQDVARDWEKLMARDLQQTLSNSGS